MAGKDGEEEEDHQVEAAAGKDGEEEGGGGGSGGSGGREGWGGGGGKAGKAKAKAASRGGHYVAGGFVDEQGVFREHLVIGHCMHLSYDIHDSTCI